MSPTQRVNNTVANIHPNDLKHSGGDTSMMTGWRMQGESPLDKGMLPRAYGDGDKDSSEDNFL